MANETLHRNLLLGLQFAEKYFVDKVQTMGARSTGYVATVNTLSQVLFLKFLGLNENLFYFWSVFLKWKTFG